MEIARLHQMTGLLEIFSVWLFNGFLNFKSCFLTIVGKHLKNFTTYIQRLQHKLKSSRKLPFNE
jgi:hypothetical protein